MPKVYEKKAAKDYPLQGIKKGDTYYEWCFYRQKPRKSPTPPTRSQLTNRSYLAQVYDVYDGDWEWASMTAEDVTAFAQDLWDAVAEAEEILGGMPEGLQQGDTGQYLELFVADVSHAADQLDDLASDMEDEDWDGDVRERFQETEPDV